MLNTELNVEDEIINIIKQEIMEELERSYLDNTYPDDEILKTLIELKNEKMDDKNE